MIQKIREFFCRHKMVRLGNDPIPENKDGGAVCMIRKHRCSKCGQERMIGSGWIY